MGIPLIHTDAPTHSPTQGQVATFQSLMDRRLEIEAALDEYGAVLDRNHITLDAPLLSPDGFPRSDIDVANVRIARTAIIRLKNDHRAVERQIEQAVHEAFRLGDNPLKVEGSTTRASARQVTSAAADSIAFCYVASVVEGSPADAAGLRAEDRVVRFGSTTGTNHDRLQGLAREVQRAVPHGLAIPVTVSRREAGREVMAVYELRPNTSWGGRGAVGAHFMPC